MATYMQSSLRESAEQRERISRLKHTKAEIAELIHTLRTNPEAIGFYQRVTSNYDLTVEEQIRHLESLETAD